MKDEKYRLQRWLLVVCIVALLVRTGLYLNYPLAQSNDSPTYQQLASSLKNHDGFSRYNGTRTPGYPTFLLLAGSTQNVYLLQLTLGFLTTLLVFAIGWQISQRAWFAGLLALAHTLDLGQIFFEATLLSEALATFLLFFILAGLVFLLRPADGQRRQPPPGIAMLITLAMGLAGIALALTRPLFAFIPFWVALFLVFFWRGASLKSRIGMAALAALPALAALLLWVNFIYTQFNIIGLDSIGGYHLVNHTTSFFELAPEQYAPIRDTFLKFRAQHIAQTGSSINTIWDAIPTLMQQTKLNYYALGRRMGEISSRLIRDHPWLYIQNLALGWGWFWRVGVFWLPEGFSNTTLRSVLSNLMLAERLGLFGVNLLFLGGSLALMWPKIRNLLKMDLFLWFAVGAIWVTSILQTLAEHGDNARFLAPMQTLLVLVIAAWLLHLFSARKTNLR